MNIGQEVTVYLTGGHTFHGTVLTDRSDVAFQIEVPPPTTLSGSSIGTPSKVMIIRAHVAAWEVRA